MGNWTSADQSKAAAFALPGKPPPAAVAFVQERVGTAKNPFEVAVFETLLYIAEMRHAAA